MIEYFHNNYTLTKCFIIKRTNAILHYAIVGSYDEIKRDIVITNTAMLFSNIQHG